jgi:hypothetical protein
MLRGVDGLLRFEGGNGFGLVKELHGIGVFLCVYFSDYPSPLLS